MTKKTASFGIVALAAASLIAAAAAGCSRGPTDALPAAAARAAEYPTVDPGYLTALEWRLVGPPRGGRATAVAGDPADPLVFYFGASHGGVWKSEDAGTYWRNISDGFFKTAPVGAIDVSLSNPSVLYVGMGESCPRQDVTPGDGVYKSTDGGATWTHVGLAETKHIAKIRIHPTNPDLVYVAAVGDEFGTNPERGVFRTKDGGQTWERVLYKSDQAGAWDLSMDPTNPNVLYASINQFLRPPWDEISGGPDSGLYKSTDGGNTWTELTRNPGLPRGVVGRIGVSLSPARPSRVWALIEADQGGLFRSDDSGQTWQRIVERRDWQRDASSYMHVVADTKDPDTVYVPDYQLWRSTDAGASFTSLPMPHGDHHALWIDPKDPTRMIEGNDGGATVTLNGGTTWSTLYNQPTAALFGLAIDNHFPYRLYGTQNDNTHISVPSRTDDVAIPFGASEWINAGEGGETAVKPDGSVVYAGDRTAIYRWDRNNKQAPVISVWPDNQFGTPVKDLKYRMYYTFPILLSPHDPGVLYTAGNIVFRTTDEGYSWEAISPDLTTNQQDKMEGLYGRPITSFTSSLYHVCLAHAIAESPLERGELWFGSDDSTVQVSRDGGQNWENVSPSDLPEWATIDTIDVSPHDRGTAYLAAHRYKMADRTAYLYKTTDYGRSWQKITNGIRENDFARVIREDPIRRGLLYAGTETGVYVSFDAGESWQSMQRNLPPVPVHYMLVKDNDLVLGTHGRGFWIMDNLTALRQITTQMAAAPAHLFEIAPTYRYLPVRSLSPMRTFRSGIQYTRASAGVVAFEDRQEANGRVKRTFLDAGQNPPGGVTIEYYLREEPSGEATLTIADAQGEVIQQFSSQARDDGWMPADAGMNRFVWDLRYPNARVLPVDPRMTGPGDTARPQAPVAPPGRYTARLVIGDQRFEQPFEIRKDPRVTATDQDLQAQFAFMVQIRDRLSEVTDAVNLLRDVRQQVDERLRAAGGDQAVAQAAAAAKEKLDGIEAALVRVVDPEHPHRVPPKGPEFRLAALTGVVGRTDAKPTQQMQLVFENLSKLAAVQLEQLQQVIEKELPTFMSITVSEPGTGRP